MPTFKTAGFKKASALLAISGMLTTPLAMAQGEQAGEEAGGSGQGVATAQNQTQGFAAGLQQATGLSATTLGVIAGVAVIGGVIVASDSSSSSGTN